MIRGFRGSLFRLASQDLHLRCGSFGFAQDDNLMWLVGVLLSHPDFVRMGDPFSC
jgi:hypothetical protein